MDIIINTFNRLIYYYLLEGLKTKKSTEKEKKYNSFPIITNLIIYTTLKFSLKLRR